MSLVNTVPTAPTVVLVLPLVTWRARVAMTVPVAESGWEEGKREEREEGKRGGKGGRKEGKKGRKERGEEREGELEIHPQVY